MSYDDVVQILGGAGEEQARTSLAGTTSVIYQWKGRGIGANMIVTFQDGEVVSKAQAGLRYCGISVFSHLRWQGQERYVVNVGCLEGVDLFALKDLPVNDGASY